MAGKLAGVHSLQYKSMISGSDWMNIFSHARNTFRVSDWLNLISIHRGYYIALRRSVDKKLLFECSGGPFFLNY